MSSGEPRRQADSSGWYSALLSRLTGSYGVLSFLGLGVGLIGMILITLSGFGGGTATGPAATQEDDPLDAARQTLERDADVSACRAALQQVNLQLGRSNAVRAAALDPKERERLQKDLSLGDDEMNEVGAETYTLLDGWHLDEAFLLRDVATHALDPVEAGDDLKPQPLERASAAFAWSVREVRLAPPTAVDVVPGDPGEAGDVRLADPKHIAPLPPQFTLRRGSGTALERALVFLDLLDQMSAADAEDAELQEGEHKPSLLGCLVLCRDKPDAAPRLWACGVVVQGGPEVYLFDPYMGIPLPGEDGKGVATLAAVCQKPALLDQLKSDGAPTYDVTAEQARTAELDLVCSLSSLAPRMRTLQQILRPQVRVSLSRALDKDHNLADLALLQQIAANTAGVKSAVQVWPEGVGVLRRFLPTDEGGADAGWPRPGFPLRTLTGFTKADDPALVQMRRLELFRLQMALWDVMPPQFRDPDAFPYNVGLGLRVRDGFMQPFVRLALEPQGPRDRLLRGEFDKAAGDLVGFGDRMRQMQQRRADEGTDGELEKKVDEWVKTARQAYAAQLVAQDRGTPAELAAANKAVAAVWNGEAAAPVVTMLQGASAGPGLAEVTYQLGLCKHEKAEQAQARLDLERSRGKKLASQEEAEARTAWVDALGWWKKYGDDRLEEAPERPSTSPGRAAAVRQMRARAQAALGDWKGAAATYEDLTEPMTPLEKIAALYRARQVRKGHEAAGP